MKAYLINHAMSARGPSPRPGQPPGPYHAPAPYHLLNPGDVVVRSVLPEDPAAMKRLFRHGVILAVEVPDELADRFPTHLDGDYGPQVTLHDLEAEGFVVAAGGTQD